jgi:putative ABC transport system permease protein
MAPVAAGIAVGVLAALALARFLDTLLYGVEPTDPATFAAVAGLLGAAALVAAWLPARRATQVDAQESLRAE